MPEAVKKPRIIIIRRLLMLLGVLVVAVVSGWFYITGGRYESTDNAYVKAAKILVTPEVSGEIVQALVHDNQKVREGEVIVVVDTRRYQIALEKAQADLAVAKQHIEELKAEYRAKVRDIDKSKVESAYLDKEYKRRVNLKNSIPISELDDFKQRLDTSDKNIAVMTAELEQIMAQLGGNDAIKTTEHPTYKAAEATLADARLNLEYTRVKAPIDGYINTAPHLGDFARADTPLFTMIDANTVWIEANFKETQLSKMKVGQPVSINIDTYPDTTIKGHIESISPGTGSEFSILPAQNATGNWVKIVQRVAVRIAIDQAPDVRLRAGMSGNVVVDTQS